ncbi:MAG: 4-hydroxy-tetrahydrodipicolinate synthase [Chloroflexi bacterium]|nr:4-hydroxy-tetrahydrodipicolinate synthase [Chloroflexota bacterium]
MAKLGRLLTAMVTPMDEAGEVDWDQTKRLANAILDSGSDGMVVGATTGEGPTLRHEEKLRLWGEVKAAVGERGAVVANTGNYSTWESIQMSREAEEVGVDGLLLTVPYYNKPPQEGIYQHFKAIAESTHLPCILYNIPGRTGVKMSLETTIKASQIDNIVGVKDATEDFELMARVIDGAANGFRIWSGNDGDTFPLMCMGGYGVICVVSNLFGKQMRNLIELTVEGNTRLAAAEHLRLLPLCKGMTGIASNPIPMKYAMNRVGFSVGDPRLPLIPADEKMAAQVDELLAAYPIDLPI